MGVDDIELGKRMIMATMNTTGTMGRMDYQNFNSIQTIERGSSEETRYYHTKHAIDYVVM